MNFSVFTKRLQKFLGIQREELPKVLLLFFFFFLVITTFWIQKPIRSSKFLIAIGVMYLPFVKVITAFLILPIVLLYSSLVKRYCRECMVIGCCLFFITGSLAFWYLFRSITSDWVHYVYFFYVDIYNTIMVALFWSFANDLNPPEQARRVYGFIGTGGILGGIFGSVITGWSVQIIGPSNLLLVCVVILMIIASMSMSLMKCCQLPMPSINKKHSSLSFRESFEGARLTLKTPYLVFITLIIICYEIVSNIVDYQFSMAVSQAITNEAALTSFLGKVSSVTMIFSILFQLVFTTWILRRFGPLIGLLILPVALFALSLLYLAVPAFTIMTLMYGSDGSLHYSVNQTSKETLYTPVDDSILYQVKAFIDMFLFRFSKGISALIILGCNLWLIPVGLKIHHFGILSVMFISIWLVAAYLAGKRFKKLSHEPIPSPKIKALKYL